jgi:serine/threonine-protein kinase
MRMAGTPHYMPPEVYSDKAIDRRSDLYQLGCVMFFLLTAKRPYRAKTRVALAVAQLEAAPRVSTKCPHPVPAELDEIVARCLAPAPEDRYDSVEALEAALSELERSLQ